MFEMIVDMAKEFNPVTNIGQCTIPEHVEARICQHIIFAGTHVVCELEDSKSRAF